MGSIIDAMSKEAEDNAKQQLAMLQKMAQAQLDAHETNIMFGNAQDQEIHSGTVVSKQKKVCIDASHNSSSIGNIMKDFFDGDIKDGFQNMIMMGVNTILGNTNIGENESQDMFVTWENNALLRIDAYYWKWNFSEKGIISKSQNVFAIFCMKRVVDMKKVDPQVLIWAISRRMKQNEGYSSDQSLRYIGNLVDRLKAIREKIEEDDEDSDSDSP